MLPENGEKKIRVNSEFFSELTLITSGLGFVIMVFGLFDPLEKVFLILDG